ncbi:hypothetical protein CPHO_00190 [Corynebacterium phocae]|uniref:Secreted protein n=1 Tax=Corynebacterium phocae TaxID=161895 RepID=A0A1L7D0K1_9CORY|nr:hypothetical protein [Corynebacterium phocae]APT91610.1 hypothetical protein CPHO_00190 [Corynebacterium phocae]KAA8720682.1 hypothetical protein F4V58_12045 [Corynebacterium phocae]
MKNLALATLVGATLLSIPATASADAIDDYLAKVPAGQISCAQAAKYYTNPGDYNAKKNQALAVAGFHPRGGEIRGAIARADEAIARCNLNGSGNHRPANQAPAPAPGRPAPAPAPAPAGMVIPVFVQPGQPTMDIVVAGYTIRIPDISSILQMAGSSR